MTLKILFVLGLLTLALFAQVDTTVSNTNITVCTGSIVANEDKNYLYNYDRLRIKSEYTKGDYFTTLIADGVHYLGEEYIHSQTFNTIRNFRSDTPFETQSSFSAYDDGLSYAKLYRFYTGYEDANDKVILGLQKISMGVGRIWTPTNLFNPRNSFALEPDEIFGVLALNYSRHLSETSMLTFVASQKKNESYKYATQYKNAFDFAEIGINVIASDDTKVLGYEIEANLFDTGIEIRSEGSYIESQLFDTLNVLKQSYFTQAILGADYGFKNGITWILEAYYSSDDFTSSEIQANISSDIISSLVFSKFYLGTSLSYSFNLVIDAGLTYIESFNEENSRFISPTLTYTLNDFNTFYFGALLGKGNAGSEYGQISNSYYLKYGLSF